MLSPQLHARSTLLPFLRRGQPKARPAQACSPPSRTGEGLGGRGALAIHHRGTRLIGGRAGDTEPSLNPGAPTASTRAWLSPWRGQRLSITAVTHSARPPLANH